MKTTTPPPVSATGPRSAHMRVADAMHEGVLTCARSSSLEDVARLMAERRVHCVVVTDEADAESLWGVVSDLDLVAAASVRELDEQSAGPTAATAALIVTPGETLQRAAQLMTEHGTAHLVVVDPATRQPVGVLSTLDIAAALAP